MIVRYLRYKHGNTALVAFTSRMCDPGNNGVFLCVGFAVPWDARRVCTRAGAVRDVRNTHVRNTQACGHFAGVCSGVQRVYSVS